MKSYIRSLVFALAMLPAPAFAAPDAGPAEPAASADSAMDRGMALVERRDWTAAAAVFRDALARDPGNAGYHNMYAYALRSGPKPAMDLVFRHYNEALRLDPRHRGAHEYLGEAYLMTGNVAKAREHLGVLDRLCGYGCREFTMLKNAIAAHEARKK